MAAIIKKLTAKFSSKSTSKYAGVIMMNGIGFYLLIYAKGSKQPIHSQQQHHVEGESWQDTLSHFLQHPLLKQSVVSIVLPSDQYQMLIVDKPDVNESELPNAIRYSAKDYLSTNLEDVAIDYFDMPIQMFGQNKVNLVAAKLSFIKPVIDICLRYCHQIQRITIDELAYQDLFIDVQEASMLVIHQPNEELLMQIVKDGQLYFFRRIRGFSKLNQYTEFEINQGAIDSLSIEIQRSLDYFESQLRQAPVKRIYISVSSMFEPLLIDKIGENFTMPVLPLKNRVVDELPETTENQHGFYPAVGAAQELIRGTY